MKKYIPTILLIFMLLGSNISQAIKYAWWVTIEYEPETTQILGIPISELDPNWVLAEALSNDAVPPEEQANFNKDSKDFGFSFAKEGDFNSDGKIDKAIVGIYKEKNGEVGRFLLVLTASNKKWVKSAIFKNTGKSGFSILSTNKGSLTWYLCMECDIFSYIKWKKGKYVLVPNDCC